MPTRRETAVHDQDGWEARTWAALGRVQERQASSIETFGLTGDVQYHWELDNASISWSRQGLDFLRGRLTMVGSVSFERRTFLWSWANTTLPPIVLGDIDRVRSYGERHGDPLLVAPGFPADHKHVQQARMMAADILGADLLWRDQDDQLERLFLVHDLQLTSQ